MVFLSKQWYGYFVCTKFLSRQWIHLHLKLDPLHLPSRLKLIDRAVRAKNFERAFVLYEEGLNWRYKAQNPRLFLEKAGRLALAEGREDVYMAAKSQWAIYFKEPYPVERE